LGAWRWAITAIFRATKDVDIVPASDPENLRHLAQVLGSLEAR